MRRPRPRRRRPRGERDESNHRHAWGDLFLSLLLLLTGAALIALLALMAPRGGASAGAILAAMGMAFGPLALVGGLLIGPVLTLIGLVGVVRSLRGPSRPQR